MCKRAHTIYLLWLIAVLIEGNGIRNIRKRSITLSASSYSNSSSIEQHQFGWRRPFVPSGAIPFEEQLRRSVGPSDFLYLFTGDTQHWHPCTMDNLACQRATEYCASKQQSSRTECNQRQSEFSNKLQQISMAALNRCLSAALGRKVIQGLIINGDLTEFGHNDELSRLKTLWTSSQFDNSIKVYPGLGNHDYDNNVGECTLDHCVNRMLRWFRTYVTDTMQFRLDLRTTTKYLLIEENTGSFAYSWDECVSQTTTQPICFHFVQLNNYPAYAKHIDGWVREWKILPSLNWLSNDLRKTGANKSVIINFHDFDTSFAPSDKVQFRNILESAVSEFRGTRILAILFAHVHERVGVKEYWCIGGRRVPLIYSGSVPGNNYMLAHFSGVTGSMQSLYALRVESATTTYVETESVFGGQETCTSE